MSYEIVKNQTRLTVLETEIVGDRLRLDGFRDALRDLLDVVPDSETLKRDQIVNIAMAFAASHINLSEKLTVIQKLKSLLGR